jgi:hypothetical protein
MQHFIPLLISASFLLGLSPRAPIQDEQEPRPALPKSARLANKKLMAQMQGAWRLVDMKLVDEDAAGFGDLRIDHIGYCLISGSYLSLEIHLRLVGREHQEQGRSFVSGLHRFELEEGAQMETSTVIATSPDPDGVPEFEPSGTKRRYKIDLAGETMTLTRDDGHGLIFERMFDDRSRFDMFGRPSREKASDSGDEDRDSGKKDGEKDDEKEKKGGGG